jgi:hypothetical protein
VPGLFKKSGLHQYGTDDRIPTMGEEPNLERSYMIKNQIALFAVMCSFLAACSDQPGSSMTSTSSATTSRAAPAPTIDYTVPNKMFPMAQPKTMACWATSGAILASWKDKRAVPTDEFVSRLSEEFRLIYDTNAGLMPADQPELMKKAKLRQELPQSYTVDAWLSMLKSYGPLWVTTAFPLPKDHWGVHARIVSAIKGDGTPDGTTLHIIDPDRGRESDMTIASFAKEMENVAKADKATDIRPMVIHF